MRIGIIGAGDVGGTLARLCTEAGHEVAIANSRGPKTLGDLVARVPGLTAVDAQVAAEWAEIVIESIPFGRFRELPAEALAGKVVLSAANHDPERDGELDLGEQVDTELVAEHLSGSRVVKAFNTIWHEHLATQGDKDRPVEDRRAIFLAGDDVDAKNVAARLVTDIGFGPVDVGSMRAGGHLVERDAELYAKDLTVAEARRHLELA